MPETKLIQLSLVRIDGQTQYRDLVDQNTVKEYTDRMRHEVQFPPVRCTFDGKHYWLWDGFHRYFASQAAGFRDIRVEFTHGTKEDAQDFALGANSTHGLPRNNATKRKQVEAALSMERHKNKSNREIAKLCEVSDSFVASVRDPEVKDRQAKNIEKHFKNKASKDDASAVKLHPDADPKPSMTQDFAPSEEELEANQKAIEADIQAMNKLLESDDALATAHAEIKKLNFDYANLESRFNALMREKNAAVELLKSAQRKLDRLHKQGLQTA